MSNAKDTPMDYKTAEEILEFQLSYSSTLFSDTMRSLYNGHAIRAMEQYANQQNASLKLELQKQKELNAELVSGLESVLRLRKLFEFAPDEFIGEAHEGEAVAINRMLFLVESLIKKSSEI